MKDEREVRNNRVTVRLSDVEWRMVDQMSFELGMSPSEIIRLTIENYYKIYQYCH